MSVPTSTLSVPVDLTNPGQFFACCGLFELADRLWPGTEAWFERETPDSTLHIAVPKQPEFSQNINHSLCQILDKAKAFQFDTEIDEGSSDADEDASDLPLDPIVISDPIDIVLDWWSDRSIKPWAGSMKERLILKAMLTAIDPSNLDPFNDSKAVFDPSAIGGAGKRKNKPKKREPFYFDCRRGSNAHPLDSGFSPDKHHYQTRCFPAVEAMCFIGLQRTRPVPTDSPNRSTYTAWTAPLPIAVIGAVGCGQVQVPNSLSFTFDNFFRTDQRKHKSYSRATRTRSNNA